MKIILFISLIVLVAGNSFCQQFPIIGQYVFNEMLINPASTGKTNSLNAQIGFRKQWVRLDGAPSTQSVSVQSPIKNKNIALGLLVFQDKIGVSKEQGFVINSAYRFKLNRETNLSLGLSGGISLNRINYSELELNDTEDPSFISNTPTFVLPYAGFGAHIEAKKYEIGFSVPKLLNRSSSLSNTAQDAKFGLNLLTYHLKALYKIELNRNLEIQPNTLIKYNASANAQIDVNLYAYYNSLLKFGLGYRTSESMLVFAGYQVNKQFSVGGQYEIALGKLASYKSGSFEIVLIYNSLFKTKANNPRMF